MPETREYYRLEALWNDAPVIDLAAEAGLENLQYSIASPSCSAARRPRATRLKAPRRPTGDWAGAAARRKARGARRAFREERPLRNGGGVFSCARADRRGFAEVLSPDVRADPHGFAEMLSREPWRNRGGVPVSCRRRPSWGGNGRWRLSAGGARGRRARRAGAVRLLVACMEREWRWSFFRR
ncbi:MAG: hypothetical protein ACLTDR_07460 [Adlercreutzia equolifaciens]